VLGAHQATNLAIAVRACEHFLGRALDDAELRSLASLRLPARLECIGPFVLDSAHTPDSARALRETLESRWPGRRWVLGLAISRDKDAAGILRELAGPTRSCVLTRAEPLRSTNTDKLRALAEAGGVRDVVVCTDPLAALDRVRELRAADELGVLTGSIYFAGAIRGKLLEGARSR
jgi:folylpolyglutamate synthase/dihydropteroate synthase